MRSTFSVSTWTWALAGCLACFLGCKQGEGDRCEVEADCSGDLTCVNLTGSPHNGTCQPRSGSGAAGSTGQTSTPASTGTGTGTSTETSTPDASIAPSDGDAAAADAAAADAE